MNWTTTLLGVSIATMGGISLSTSAGERKIVALHDGFADFSRGSFPDGGTNIYVSHAGVLQLIPQWDLNNDGHLDLLINQDENEMETVDAFIYWGNKQGYKSLFPAFWNETMPAYKLVQSIEKREKHVSFLPTFGGGPVRVVDLNRDGFQDIVFPNVIHNYTVHMEAYIYWGGPEGHSAQRMTKLPTLFSRDLAVADFNCDGYLDLAFANYGNETGDRWGYKHHLESFIYWGGAEGYSPKRRTSIPTISAVSCAAGDFNGDSWPDIAFANNNLRQNSVFVYLGDREGFSPERRLHVEGGNSCIVRAGDLNGDKIDDLLIGSQDRGSSMYLGSSDFDLKEESSHFPIEATDVGIADFNGDGHVDVAFATLASAGTDNKPGMSMSEVYWGSNTGFDPENRLLLPTLSPRAVATADLNDDGFAELIFANHSDGESHDVPSYVYWGSAAGFNVSNRTNLQGFGPVGVSAEDLNNDGMPEIVLINQSSGAVDGGVSSVVFWGNAAHVYSEADATLLPAKGPYGSKIADLNDDQYPDIIFTGEKPCIHWGGDGGFKKMDWFDFGERILGVVVGDFNKDGSLDLAFSSFGLDPREPNEVILLWGSADGFDEKVSTRIRLKADRSCCGISAADVNNDGYLDLILPSGESMNRQSQILWGDPKGFEAVPSTLLSTDGVGAPTIADLDGNGWLELIFPGLQDIETQNPHCKTLIYWGNEEGFDDLRRTELEAYTTGEIVVADLNTDGYLDLVASNYKSDETRSLPIFIFWGNAKHEYSNEHRSELPAESSLGIQVLDLNDDDFLDIVVHNHIKDGDHTYGGYIYWGDGQGYTIERRTHLPIVGPHYSLGISPGNIFDRKPGVEFHSPTIALPDDTRKLELDWSGETPHKTAVHFNVRVAPDESSLAKKAWQPVSPGEPFLVTAGSKCLQYNVVLVSPNGANTPLVRNIRILAE